MVQNQLGQIVHDPILKNHTTKKKKRAGGVAQGTPVLKNK
jgi:hypothetical protein